MKNKCYWIFVLTLACSNMVLADNNFVFEPPMTQPVNTPYVQTPLQYSNKPLQGSVTIVPAGATLPAVTTFNLSSANLTTGQAVSMALSSDYYYNNQLIAPAGSTIYGTVIEASKAKRGSMNGKLCVRFTHIYTPYGTQIPISAVIKTTDSTGVLVGGTAMDVSKQYAKDIAAGSATGALSGLIFGALAGGNVGRGTALGTAVGAGGGLVKSAWDKGNDVEIPANATIELMLTQPITVSSSGYSYEN